MKLILDDWQREALDYEGNLLLCTGRQVGKTFIMSIKAGEYMMKHPNSTIIVASLTEDQAKLIIFMILTYLQGKYPREISLDKDKPTQNKIVLKNGSQVLARPVGNTGDAIRGFTGNILILDEVSRFNQLILTSATPTLMTTGGQIWMCSTPFGKQGYFWEQFDLAYNKKDKKSRFKVIYRSSEDVIFNRPVSESWTQEKRDGAIEHLKQEKATMSVLAYGQEYQGLFLEDLMRYFSDEWIESVCRLQPQNPSVSKYYIGQDIARMGGDQGTWEVIRKVEDKLYHVSTIARTMLKTNETINLTLEQNKIWKPRKIGIDAGSGSLGVTVFDMLLQHPEISSKLVAMNNRAVSLNRDGNEKQKMFGEDMYELVRALGEQGKLKLLDDEEVKASLRSVQFSYGDEDEIEKGKKAPKLHIFGNYTHHAEGIKRAVLLAWEDKSLNLYATYSNDERPFR